MNLNDLKTFFNSGIVQPTSQKAIDAMAELQTALGVADFEFSDAANPSLKGTLEAFFLPRLGTANNADYLCRTKFTADITTVTAGLSTAPQQALKNNILAAINTAAMAWGQEQVLALGVKIYTPLVGYSGGQLGYISGAPTPTTTEDRLQAQVYDAFFNGIWNWLGWLLNSAGGWANWTGLFATLPTPLAPPNSSLIQISDVSAGNYQLGQLQADITALNNVLGGTALWDSKAATPETVQKQIPNGSQVDCYTVHDLSSYIGAIRAIGLDTNTNKVARVIRIVSDTAYAVLGSQQTQIDFVVAPPTATATNRSALQDNATYVFFSKDDQYAYPFRIQGQHVADLWRKGGKNASTNLPYLHSYLQLIKFAKENLVDQAALKADPNTVKANRDAVNFVVAGLLGKFVPDVASTDYTDGTKMGGALNIITVLAANYIVEPCRNSSQLLLGIVQLSWQSAAFMNPTQFPMGPGGWHNRWSWGCLQNPNAPAGATWADGEAIRRWFLSLFFVNADPTQAAGTGFLIQDSAIKVSDLLPWVFARAIWTRGAGVVIMPPNLDQVFANYKKQNDAAPYAVKNTFQGAVEGVEGMKS